MPGPFYFALIDGPVVFNPSIHNVYDEPLLSLKVAQEEGEFAELEAEIANPGDGLLAPGRKQWCWLSWFNGTSIVPLFLGRMIAVEAKIEGEVMTVLFRAKPIDYETTRETLADSLKVLPYYDPVCVVAEEDDPQTVLQAYGAEYHIDRLTHQVTISNHLVGEAGTIELAGEQFYDEFNVEFAEKPAKKWKCTATFTWTQSGQGTIDITKEIDKIFRAQKSIHIATPGAGIITSLTGDGLKSDWPKGGTSFGGGWSVNADTFIEPANDTLFPSYTYDVTYQGLKPEFEDAEDRDGSFWDAYTDWTVKFPVVALKQSTKFDWVADRKRTEILELEIVADVQPLAEDEDDDDAVITLTVNAADTVTEPNALGEMPIVDTRRVYYLPTDRGVSTMVFLLLTGIADLRLANRAVDITVRIPFATAIGVTCRHNADLLDRRAPGGHALGKVIGYSFQASGTGENFGEVKIGCAIGRNGSQATDPGEPTYVEIGYVSAGYQQMTGTRFATPSGDLVYEPPNASDVDDDGIDLIRLDAETAIDSLTLTGGLSDQVDAVTGSSAPIEALEGLPSLVCLQLFPVAGQSFESTFAPFISQLPIPKMIDLEVAA